MNWFKELTRSRRNSMNDYPIYYVLNSIIAIGGEGDI